MSRPPTAPVTLGDDSAGPADTARAQPLLVLLHIPKTAGMTLATIMHAHYDKGFVGGVGGDRSVPPEKRAPNVFSRFEHLDAGMRAAARDSSRALAAHITFGLHDRLPADARWLTVLREPVERTLSQYFFFVRPPGKRASAGAGFVPPWLPPPTPELTLAECLTERGYIPDNLQTRMLCGLVSPYDPLPGGALEQAKRNLRDRFAFVGTTERFEEYLALLNLALGWPTVAYKRSNANPSRPRKEDLPADVLRLVEERNALDRELHAYAGDLLAGALDQAGPDLEREVEVIRRSDAQRHGAAGPEIDVRSLPLEARVALALQEGELAEAQLRVRRLNQRLAAVSAEAAAQPAPARGRRRGGVRALLARVRRKA
jgi:Galactose-3-O-sulfotransferase